MYQVYDNGRKADIYDYPQFKGLDFKVSKFGTFDDAVKHAKQWLWRIYEVEMDIRSENVVHQFNTANETRMIEIREV